MENLTTKHCIPCEGGVAALTREEIKPLLSQISDWEVNDNFTAIHRNFQFKNFYHTMAFVNAIAWIANQENHHPDLHLENYRNVWIELWTHAIGGLSENDFICAAKVNELVTSKSEKICKIPSK